MVPAIVEFLHGPVAANPHRVGKPLREDLDGLYGVRRGSYRVRYETDEHTETVTVLRIAHRRAVYRPR